jgi:hypothetical protein
MKLKYEDSILEKIIDTIYYDTKLWKVWAAIRYDIPLFFKNIWRFRKELYNHQWWDYRFTLEMLYRSLSIMVVKLEADGIEVDSSRMKKVEKIKRVLELLKHKIDDTYIEIAEGELGKLVMHDWEFEEVEDRPDLFRLVDNDTPAEKIHNGKIFKRAKAIEEQEWKEIWDTIKGTKLSKDWENYDGTDMRGWWD